ncbi:hypothetical protein TIFTF001_056516 [Ficus carica]|uniref:Uncharacterized protein n=1 Tax=Ficus carica TaxID=3494 RepID=A0AA88EIW6_FICCA|nr:hypothetical protein TIFTF001_056516 [Ficus carica]
MMEVRVMNETSPLEEDRRCRKEQGGEILQRLSFGNAVSLDNVDLVLGKNSFFINFNNGCGFPTFCVDGLSTRYESWHCFGPARIASMLS